MEKVANRFPKRNLLSLTNIKKQCHLTDTAFYILLLPIIVSALTLQQDPDCAIIALSRFDISQHVRMLHQPAARHIFQNRFIACRTQAAAVDNLAANAAFFRKLNKFVQYLLRFFLRIAMQIHNSHNRIIGRFANASNHFYPAHFY